MDEMGHLADEQAMLASTLADEDDDCWILAHKLVTQCSYITSAEVTDEISGEGAIYLSANDQPEDIEDY